MTRRAAVSVFVIGVFVACERHSTATPDESLMPTARPNAAPFVTTEPLQARFVEGVTGTMKALATVGDVLPGSALPLAPVPDGIGVWGGRRYLHLMMSHEISASGVDGQFRHARVSKMLIDLKTLVIVDHRYVIDGSEGYSRLCSAEWVDAGDGFPGGYFFTGEETDDGLQLIIDDDGRVTEAPWIGRYAHENQISVPGFPGHVVVLNFDDNGGDGVGRVGSTSELYMYVARNSKQVMRGTGQLYVYKANDEELLPSDLRVDIGISGTWLSVPDHIARDHQALEQFADDEKVFPFVRLEDGFYDKRPKASRSAYFFDTGRSSITDEQGSPLDPWGSIYRLDFEDPFNPAGGVTTLTLLARSVGPDQMWASPDNGDMSADGTIMLQEDPANGPWNRRPGIYALQLDANGSLVGAKGRKVVELVDPNDPSDETLVFGNESSGIVDLSEWMGRGSWLFDVQAHDMPVPRLGLTRENGQLIYIRIDN